jgi:hypothetical protein
VRKRFLLLKHSAILILLVVIIFSAQANQEEDSSQNYTSGLSTLKKIYFPGEEVIIKTDFLPNSSIVVSPAGMMYNLSFSSDGDTYSAKFSLKKDVVLGNYTIIADGIADEFTVDYCAITAYYEEGLIKGDAKTYITKPERITYEIDGKEEILKLSNNSFEIPVPAGRHNVLLKCGLSEVELEVFVNFTILIENETVTAFLDGKSVDAVFTVHADREYSFNGSFNLSWINSTDMVIEAKYLHLKVEKKIETETEKEEKVETERGFDIRRVYFPGEEVIITSSFKPEKAYAVNPIGMVLELNFSRKGEVYQSIIDLKKDIVLGEWKIIADGIEKTFFVDSYRINATFERGVVKGDVEYYFVEPESIQWAVGESGGQSELKNGSFTIPLNLPPGNYTIVLSSGNAHSSLNISIKEKRRLEVRKLNFINDEIEIRTNFKPESSVIVLEEERFNITFKEINGTWISKFIPKKPGKYRISVDEFEEIVLVDEYRINASLINSTIKGNVSWHYIEPEYLYYIYKEGKTEKKEKIKLNNSQFEIPVDAKGKYIKLVCGNAEIRIELPHGKKIDKSEKEIIAFDPVKREIVIKIPAALKERFKEFKKMQITPNIKGMRVAFKSFKSFKNLTFYEMHLPVSPEILKKYNIPSEVLNTTTEVKKLGKTMLRLELNNKIDTWYRFSVPLPEGYRVKEIVGDDGRRIVNTIQTNRSTGETEGDIRWYIENNTLYFYDDPIWGYNISLTPPAPNNSIAIELAYSGTYSGAGQISAIVFPYNQGDDASTIATYDHAGRTEDNGYGNDIDINAGSKIAIKYSRGTISVEFGNPWNPLWFVQPLGNDYITHINRIDVPINTVPTGELESVIITEMQSPTWRRTQLNITQKVIIRDNYRWFATIYYIENVGSRDITNLRFFQGMDWNFRGSYWNDNGYYDTVNDVVYGYDTDAPIGDIHYGGYSSDLSSSQHDVAYYSILWSRIDSDSLTNSNSYTGDAATALAWDRISLAAGEKWVVPIIWGLGYNFSDMVAQIDDGKSKLYDAGILSIDSPANNTNFNPATAGVVYFNATAALFGLVDLENLEVIFNVTKVGGGYSYQTSTYINLSIPFNETANVSFPLNISSLPYGKYKVSFKTNLTNDQNLTNDEMWIYINVVAFTVEPDQSTTANPGIEVFYNLTSANYFSAGRFDINITASTKGWTTRLYNNSQLIAEDNDGDGMWDTVLNDTNSNGLPDVFLPYGISYINTSKIIPSSTPLGETDITILNFTYIADSSISDDVRLETSTPSPPTEQKEFYLHSNFVMNTTPPSSQSQTQISPFTMQSWYQSPPFASDFRFYDRAYVNLWLSSALAGQYKIVVSLIKTDGVYSETIGTNSSSVILTTTPSLQTLTIKLLSPVQLKRGEYMILRVENQNANSIFVSHSSAYDSNLTLNTTTYIRISEIYSTTCYVGDTTQIFANVSDPIGSHDIISASINIYFENGTLYESGFMNANKTDTSTPSLWKLFDYQFSAPLAENYTVDVTALETNGVRYSTIYTLSCTRPISPVNLTAKLSFYFSNTSIEIMSLDDASNIKVYWTKPQNISISSMSGDYDANGSSGDVYWWLFNTIAAGETKYVYLNLSASGEFNPAKAFNIGVDPAG